jgi:hypothetical protein
MGEQALDLRTGVALVRRHRVALAAAALLGLAGGTAVTAVRPPLYSSFSEVLLPSAQTVQQAAPDPQTQAEVASSAAVLGPAGQELTPPLSVEQIAAQVTVSSPSATVLGFRAHAVTAEQAQRIAGAVADAEVAYIQEAAASLQSAQRSALRQRETTLQQSLDAVGAEIRRTTARRAAEGPTTAAGRTDSTALAQLTAEQANLVLQLDQVRQQAQAADAEAGPSTARVIQPATPAERPGTARRLIEYGGAGAVSAVALLLLGLALFVRHDRRLRYRDQIADALGSTVISSVHARTPRTVAGWTDLLTGYEPGTSDTWALRQLLRHIDVAEDRPRRVTVITLAGDRAALALGPQLAVYSASTGLRTRLAASQRHETATALWAACHRARSQEEIRPGLYVGAHPATDPEASSAALTVVLVVLDRRRPELVAPLLSEVTLLAVSAGSVTAEEIARAAVTVDDAGIRIDGMVVVNPDDLDRTTGRLLPGERAAGLHLPALVRDTDAPVPTLLTPITRRRR